MSMSAAPAPAIPDVLEDPILDKGTAFTESERDTLGLTGRLPSAVLTLDQQAQRAYQQMLRQRDDLAKNVYMEQLHDRNEVLYYRVLADHLAELLPVVYDPVIGDAIELYSHEYRRPRGLYLSIDRPDDMDKAFASLGLGTEDVDLIVCSDAEEILGIGDWGVAGSMIAVGKLAVYTAAAGVDPRRVIPVSLDVGTNNEGLLNDPLYLGNRHARVRGADYDAFIKKYLQTASARFPNALLHFEDFGADNARWILLTYRDQYRIFNDDMQGTGVITMAGLFSALKVTGTRWRDQRVIIFGGGTAGVGIADQIRDQMIRNGLDPGQATRQIWIVDLPGLLTDDMLDGMLDYQRPYVRAAAEVADWEKSPVQIDPAAAVRWPEMAALAAGARGFGHHRPADRGREGEADHPDRHLDDARRLHQGRRGSDERRRQPAGHLPAVQPDLQDRGHACRHHHLVQGTSTDRHWPAHRAIRVRRRDLPVRAGQQRPGLSGAGPRHDRLRRSQGHRRDAACRRPRPSQARSTSANPAPRCCPR